MSQQQGVDLVVASFFVVVPALGVVQVVRARKRRSVMADYAKSNGWTFKAVDNYQERPGPPFEPTYPGTCQDVVSGTARGRSFAAFQYVPGQSAAHGGSGKRDSAVVVIKLPRFLPSLEVRPEGAVARAMPHATPSDTVVQFESSEFNDSFRVAASIPKFASDILTPPLMEYLLTAPRVNWRIWGNDLLGWSPGANSPSKTLEILSVLIQVERALPTFVWDMYGSTASPALTASGGGVAVSASGATQAPPGWYVDPGDPQQARWWDGNTWTPRVAEVRAR